MSGKRKQGRKPSERRRESAESDLFRQMMIDGPDCYVMIRERPERFFCEDCKRWHRTNQA
jgi:hypothetical protein